MLLIDDHLALRALQGLSADLWGDRVPSVPWICHLRIIRAMTHSSVEGQLSRLAAGLTLDAALDPHPELLKVLDPRPYTKTISRFHGRRGVSLMAAELLGTAVATRGEVHIARANFNSAWTSHLDGTGVTIIVYNSDDLSQPDPA